MTGAKSTFDKVDDDMVTKMVEATSSLEAASQHIEPLKRRVLSGSDEKAKTYLSAYESSFQAAKNLVGQVNANIESTKERLELKKISYEAREIAARAWPRKTWVEKMTWVATALFPSGGVGFVVAGGLTEAALLFALVIWSVAITTLIASLWSLKNEDMRKWEFFKREFDISSEDLVSSATPDQVMLTKWTVILSLAIAMFLCGVVFLTTSAIDLENPWPSSELALSGSMIGLGLAIMSYILLRPRIRRWKKARNNRR